MILGIKSLWKNCFINISIPIVTAKVTMMFCIKKIGNDNKALGGLNSKYN
jgi:hypothetical protein